MRRLTPNHNLPKSHGLGSYISLAPKPSHAKPFGGAPHKDVKPVTNSERNYTLGSKPKTTLHGWVHIGFAGSMLARGWAPQTDTCYTDLRTGNLSHRVSSPRSTDHFLAVCTLAASDLTRLTAGFDVPWAQRVQCTLLHCARKKSTGKKALYTLISPHIPLKQPCHHVKGLKP